MSATATAPWKPGRPRRLGDERQTYVARELDPVEAVPVLRTYLSMPSERFVRRSFVVTKRSTAAEIEADAPRHPTFALTPRPPT